jgi:addiction module RelE/StbE family toxin
MNYILLRSSAFIRSARKILKKQPELAENVQNTLELLSTDPFHPRLKTHKLKGDLQDSWACSAGYDLRIIFKFVEQEQEKTQAILLESIGTHDEVY